MDIKLKCKLSAYTKGILPTRTTDLINDSDFISDAPKNDVTWARKNGEWVNASEIFHGDDIVLEENSGLESRRLNPDTITLKVRQWTGLDTDLPDILEEDMIYYVMDTVTTTIDNAVEPAIHVGTAFSDENEEATTTISGGGDNGVGGASIVKFDKEIRPLNAWGVYSD